MSVIAPSASDDVRRNSPVILPLERRFRFTPIPRPITPLIGRQQEVTAAGALLRRDGVRLVTLSGSGGIGKTRLAIEIGAQLADEFADGVGWIPLAPVTQASGVLSAMAMALGVSAARRQSVLDSLKIALHDSKALIILDNFEHVVEAAPDVAELLAAAPSLRMLATSRSPLNVSGEHVFAVPPLTVPDLHQSESVERLADVAAIQLFVARAQAVAPRFSLSMETASVTADICRRLDGLPLAIELAAARVSHMPLPALRDRLEHRLPLLTGGARDLPTRLRTMRSAIVWSFDLLSPDEQALFRLLAVFIDGFALEAAEAVGASSFLAQSSPHPSTAVLDLLSQLVAKSLVQYEDAGLDGGRYRILEMVREFAAEHLAAHAGADDALRAHAAYHLRLAEESHLTELAPNGAHLVAVLETEHANLRAALAWFETNGDSRRFVGLAAALSRFWIVRDHLREGRTWLERALASLASGETAPRQAEALVGLGMIALHQGDVQRAQEALDEGLTRCRAMGEALNATQALIGLAVLALGRDDNAGACSLLSAADVAAAAIADPRLKTLMAARVQANLGVAARSQGDLVLAQTLHEAALSRFREVGYRRGIILSLGDLGDVALGQRNYHQALGHYREVTALNGDKGESRVTHDALVSSAIAASALGQAERAARWFGAAEKVRERAGLAAALFRVDSGRYQRALGATRVQLGEERFTALWDAGRTLSPAQANEEVGEPFTETRPDKRRLTRRESDVLRLLAAGRTDREIAAALYLGTRTIESHVARICAKLGVRSRTVAVAAAIKAGLLDPPAQLP